MGEKAQSHWFCHCEVLPAVRPVYRYNKLERIPQKLTDFCDWNALQLCDLARFLIARMIPCERKAR